MSALEHVKITPQEQKGLRHGFHITVGAPEIDRQIDHELRALGSRVKIPGFRPGKIPMPVLRQRYGKNVMGEVLQNAVNRTASEVMKDKKLKPALKPDIQITEYKEGGDLEFTMNVEVLPDVPTIALEKITVEKLVFDLPEEEIAAGIDRLRERYRHTHTAKEGTKAKAGDLVKIDFLGKVGGVAFEGGEAKNFQLELGSGQFIQGFEEQLEGAKAGDEVLVKVTFPEQYHSAELAGKPAEFEVKVHEVLYFHTPDADDDFAKKLGFQSLDELKDKVREQLVADYEGLARNRAKKDLFDQLDEQVKFDVPEGMLGLEFDSIWQRVSEAKQAGDASLADRSEEDLKAEYRTIAERRVKLGILLSELASQHKIQISKEELTKAVMDQARMFPGQEQKVLEFYKNNPEHVDELRGPILEEKTVDFLLEKVKRTDRKVDVDELMQQEEEGAPKKKAAKKSAKKEDKSDKKAADKPKATAPAKKAGTTKKPAAKKKAAK